LEVEDVLREFQRIGKSLPRRVGVLLLGGVPMVMRGQKISTIDVDLALFSEEDKLTLEKTLAELGYVRSGKMRFEELVNKYRIEMDVNKFIRTPVTERMVNRAEKRSMGLLELFLISNEDNILFKSMTEREKDIDDIFSIVSRAPINWDIIYEELKMLTEKEILEKGLNEATIYPAFVAVKLREVKDKYNLVDEGLILKFEDLASSFMERIMKKRESKV